MKIRGLILSSIASVATSSCVLAQESFVIREISNAPIIASISAVNREGWYLQQSLDGAGELKAFLVGPKNYQRDVTGFIPQNVRFATGVSSAGDLFLAERAAKGETSILRLARDGNNPIEVGTLKINSDTSVIKTNNAGETFGVSIEGSYSERKSVQVNTLSLDGKVSAKQTDLRSSIPAKALYIKLFLESEGHFTIVAERIGAPRKNDQKAVCKGEGVGKKLVCRTTKQLSPSSGNIVDASNGKLLVAGGLRAAVADALNLKIERTIARDGGSGMLLTSFLERDGSLGALVQNISTGAVRLKRITPAGKRLSYICPSSLGWPSITFFGEHIGSIDSDSTAFLVSSRNEAGDLSHRLYEITAEGTSPERSGEILGRCELETQREK